MRIKLLDQQRNPELLLPSASDCAWVRAMARDERRRLDEERLAGFNQSTDLSTYPQKISVRTTRATTHREVVGEAHSRGTSGSLQCRWAKPSMLSTSSTWYGDGSGTSRVRPSSDIYKKFAANADCILSMGADS
jgi:hypothetical protein